MVTSFWRQSVKMFIPTFILYAGIPQRIGDRNTDGRVYTADDQATSDKNMVNFGPAT